MTLSNIQERNRLNRLKEMDDESFIRYIVMESVILVYLTDFMFQNAEEWCYWCIEEFESNYYQGKNFKQLTSDHKYYIEECIANAIAILDKHLMEKREEWVEYWK